MIFLQTQRLILRNVSAKDAAMRYLISINPRRNSGDSLFTDQTKGSYNTHFSDSVFPAVIG